ncbi:response regulator [Fundidesulfovibrio butyratiphilus]
MRPKTLIIDDEVEFATTLAERLELRGFPVSVAHTGNEGVDKAASEEPSVVVLDLNLPDRTGLDVLREIKGRWPLIAVVLLTGQAAVGSAVAGMKLGAFDYLSKPANVDDLAKILERAEAGRRDQEESLRMMETGKLAMLGKLAEGVAHEIMNPVAIMMQKAGLAEEILEDGPELSAQDLADVLAELSSIQTQGRRCKAIVSKLMSFGGRIDPRVSRVDVEELLEASLGAFQNRMESLGVTPRIEVEPDLPDLLVARAQLEQVLHHLTENALDAIARTGSGGRLTISARKDGDRLEIEVADTGPGIPPGVIERVFEPFFSTKQVGQGSGLGLSICHGIVTSLGGDIRAESPPEGGARLTFSLPAERFAPPALQTS